MLIKTYIQNNVLFSSHLVSDLYAVVRFLDDKSVCCVPLKRIDLGEAVQPELSSIYPVQWTSRKKFNAEVLAIGTLKKCKFNKVSK